MVTFSLSHSTYLFPVKNLCSHLFHLVLLIINHRISVSITLLLSLKDPPLAQQIFHSSVCWRTGWFIREGLLWKAQVFHFLVLARHRLSHTLVQYALLISSGFWIVSIIQRTKPKEQPSFHPCSALAFPKHKHTVFPLMTCVTILILDYRKFYKYVKSLSSDVHKTRLTKFLNKNNRWFPFASVLLYLFSYPSF